jgi:23S rRNA (uracil1939-C5)-methyltransferase
MSFGRDAPPGRLYDKPMNEKIRLQLISMTQGGEAMGRDDTGRVVFVPYAIAGEEVVVEIVEAKKNYARARLVEIVTPSPVRVTPRCLHFGQRGRGEALPKNDRRQNQTALNQDDSELDRESSNASPLRTRGCGGCQWQHIAYAAQLKFKTDIVREQFARIGKLPAAPVRDAIGMAESWRYRNNAQFQLDDAGRLCFRAMESHQLVQISECHIMHPLLDEMFHSLELEGSDFSGVTLRAGIQTGQKLLILEGRDDELPEISTDEPVSIVYQTPGGKIFSLVGKEALHEELRGRMFRVSPPSFFQVNTPMAETLIDLVERYLAPRVEEVLLDAFGGVGTFGLSLASRVARVIEIEESKDAVNDAKANAVDLANVEFHCGAVEHVLPELKSKIDWVVADPPRAGIAPQALDALVAKSPRAIAYVSCDPATLARDARRLIDGGYQLREVQPVDLFPQTYHIESVSWFER